MLKKRASYCNFPSAALDAGAVRGATEARCCSHTVDSLPLSPWVESSPASPARAGGQRCLLILMTITYQAPPLCSAMSQTYRGPCQTKTTLTQFHHRLSASQTQSCRYFQSAGEEPEASIVYAGSQVWCKRSFSPAHHAASCRDMGRAHEGVLRSGLRGGRMQQFLKAGGCQGKGAAKRG